ncbi:MAG: hypothetical protein A2289_09015 [Deltaproteobacteria bacterium RIFOXYA12_FULL_58_15]|nr:MAG: hypothetical protein A2289_09015 [Deltaproteobacteria bacterium RIFOXYA12_FULL_58_15]
MRRQDNGPKPSKSICHDSCTTTSAALIQLIDSAVRSPDGFDVWVFLDLGVIGDDGDLRQTSCRNNDAVRGISVEAT